MRAFCRDAEFLASQHIRRGMETGQIRDAPPYRRIRFLCTSCTKLQQGIAAGNLPDTGRFGSDQGLKVHKVQECRFDQLCLENGAFHSNERLIREYQRPSFME